MTRGPRELVSHVLRRGGRDSVQNEIDELRLILGRMESRMVRSAGYKRLSDAEFRIFSQFGEDGIIQHLLGHVSIENETFIEFGVADYRESNTRFLLCNDNWRGLIMDGGVAHIEFVRSNPLGWRNQIDARSAFITRENVNELIGGAGFAGDVGLVSIDIDGNDYWVLEALTVVSPRILIVEYNSTFGSTAAVSIPYDPDFNRTDAHASNLYWGASLQALIQAADRKGHVFVGSNSAGNNAFFVRRDVLGDVSPVDGTAGWVDARFRESRSSSGELTYVDSREKRVALIADLPLVDVSTGATTTVGAAAST